MLDNDAPATLHFGKAVTQARRWSATPQSPVASFPPAKLVNSVCAYAFCCCRVKGELGLKYVMLPFFQISADVQVAKSQYFPSF
jgi:hypothetical protein